MRLAHQQQLLSSSRSRHAAVRGAAATAAAAQRGRRCAVRCNAADDRGSAAGETAPVRFRMRQKVEYGERLCVVGNQPSLGDWCAEQGLRLKWHDNDVWAGSVELPVGTDIEFKCVRVRDDGSATWEDGSNRSFKAWGPSHSLDVRCAWNATKKTDVHAQEVAAGEQPFRELSSLLSIDEAAAEAEERAVRAEEERRWLEAERAAASASAMSSGYTSGTESDEDFSHASAWQGKRVTFMRSNEHSKERQGVWDVTKLPPVGSPLHEPLVSLVRGDEKAPNWLSKLGVVKKELVDEAERARPDVPELAAGYVYLQWVTTGAIPCVEGGGHYRPNHHAMLAQHIFRSLEWVIEDDADPARAATLLARKISTRLPSFGEAFTCQVPLTRIRDIAHRGDIPHELKQEIKHTLQNKLHRNAGPEDLVAAEEMMGRLNGGNYSGAFVNEFRIFVAELREFFNAAGLTDLLSKVKETLGPEDCQVVDFFLRQKGELDNKGQGASLEDLVATCHALTTVRALLMGGLNSGLRNDAPDSALAMRQSWRLAEVRCEDYAFVLLSRFINKLEEQGGSNALLSAHDVAWAPCLGALVLGLRQLGLGGWAPAEALAIESELAAWQREGGFQERENALRLKASLERLQRLTEAYSEQLLELLPPVATALGAALGVAQHAINTFTEAEIRANVVFQVSKLTTAMLRACRAAAGCSSWDPLVVGSAVGRLVEMQSLDLGALAGLGEPVVLLLREASGDEEVAAAGSNLKGVVLTQDLPHLSHLGVRARQEKMPFTMLDDPSLVDAAVKPLLGQMVALDITPDSVNLTPASSSQAAAAASAAAAAAAAAAGGARGASALPAQAVSKVESPRLLQLLDCTPSLAGAKASSCARLEQVSLEAKGQQGAFSTPRGVCVPFGVMDIVLAGQAGALQQRFAALLAASEAAPLAELTAIADELQGLVASLQLPDSLLQSITAAFPPGSLLIARSSANVEDLAGMSGAGLYESIPNVPSDRPADISVAVAGVWASLYTRRAILSRRAAGVAQADAAMAVLIQELLAPAYSFVLHTAAPLGNSPSTAEVEVAAGLGETLASGTRGSAWRLAVNKASGAVRTLAFANFSEALLPASAATRSASPAPAAAELAGVGPAVAQGRPGGLYSRAGSPQGSMQGSVDGDSGSGGRAGSSSTHGCAVRVMDYSRHPLSQTADARVALGRRIAAVASCMEASFGGAQDVEGCLVGDTLFVVQTRPQP